jgi:predicted nucleic acid-binding protein
VRELAIAGARHLTAVPPDEAKRRELLAQLADNFLMSVRGSAGTQRMPIVDYLLAAAAQELGAAVIHYDRDYDTLAEVLEFESVWLAPAGTLP